MDFIPDSKRKKGKMDLIELLYGDHVCFFYFTFSMFQILKILCKEIGEKLF